jgi:hypothetical protein
VTHFARCSLSITLSLLRLDVSLPLPTSNLSFTISALRGFTQLDMNKDMPKIYVDCMGVGMELGENGQMPAVRVLKG